MPAKGDFSPLCRRCGERPRAYNYINAKGQRTGGSYCLECRRESATPRRPGANAEYTRRHKIKKYGSTTRAALAANLWRQHHLALEDYEAMLEEQGGVCAICGAEPGVKRLQVDHDHRCCPSNYTCGRCVRMLLCQPCNQRVGVYEHMDFAAIRRYAELWG